MSGPLLAVLPLAVRTLLTAPAPSAAVKSGGSPSPVSVPRSSSERLIMILDSFQEIDLIENADLPGGGLPVARATDMTV